MSYNFSEKNSDLHSPYFFTDDGTFASGEHGAYINKRRKILEIGIRKRWGGRSRYEKERVRGS